MAERNRAGIGGCRRRPDAAVGRALALILLLALTAAAQLSPELAELARQGIRHRQEGRLAEAEAAFEAIAEEAPELLPAWLNLGLTRHEMGLYQEAVEAFQKALELDPEAPGVDRLLGFDLVQLGRYEEAIPLLEGSVEPDDAATASALHFAYLKAAGLRTADGELEAAIGLYESALELEPTTRGIRRTIGDLLVELGRLDRAVASYRDELALGPDAVAATRLGEALMQAGLSEEAVGPLRQALGWSPESAQARLFLGRAFADLDRLDEAVVELQAVLALEPPIDLAAQAHYALGLIRSRQGDAQASKVHFDAFRRLRAQALADGP